MKTLLEIFAFLALVVLSLAVGRLIDDAIRPPQPNVLVDVPDPGRAPIDDLDLNGANHV